MEMYLFPHKHNTNGDMLILKALSKICNSNSYFIFQRKYVLTFHVNCLLGDNSHEMSRIIFFEKKIKMLSAAVETGPLRVKTGKIKEPLSY